jgi:hypothetical protein
MSGKFFTPPQPSPNPRGGNKKFTNDLGLLYLFQEGGIIEVKGKGKMKTYLLIGKK